MSKISSATSSNPTPGPAKSAEGPSARPAPRTTGGPSASVVDSYDRDTSSATYIRNSSAPLTWAQWLWSWTGAAKQFFVEAKSAVSAAASSALRLIASLFNRIFILGADLTSSKADKHRLFQDQSDALLSRIRAQELSLSQVKSEIRARRWTAEQETQFFKKLEQGGIKVVDKAATTATGKGKARATA